MDIALKVWCFRADVLIPKGEKIDSVIRKSHVSVSLLAISIIQRLNGI